MSTTVLEHNVTPKRKPAWMAEVRVKQSMILLVIAYLLFALILPLGYVFIKALQSYEFDLNQVELQLDQGAGWETGETLQVWFERTGHVVKDGLRASEPSREQMAKIVPKNDRRDLQRFRLRDLSATSGILLIAG